MSSASLSRTSSSVKTNIAKGKKDEKADEKSKRQELVNRYTIIILFFGLFLVVVSVIFLYLEVSENNSFKQRQRDRESMQILHDGMKNIKNKLNYNKLHQKE